MKILVGVTPDSSASDAMALAAVIQRSFGGEVVLGNVYAAPGDQRGKRKVDAEWVSFLRADAVEVVTDAAAEAPRRGLTDFETAIHGHRSSGVGLSELAHQVKADVIVLGSAPGASNGRFLIGSTADQLLHGSHVPVAIAPAGYRRVAPAALGRLVVAFQDTPESHKALEWAAERADGRRLTALTVLIRHRIMGSNLAFDAEGLVSRQIQEDAQEALDGALRALGTQADAQITVGDDALSAVRRIDWHGDELLVLASGGSVLRRVFLGDMTYKLVRATPVPAIVLPRDT
jgi:nucleotide-binding universal stress UspA family protein